MHELRTFIFPFRNITLYRAIAPYLVEDNRRGDRFILFLSLLHWMAALFITSEPYNTHLLGLVGGGILFALTLIAYRLFRGTRIFRIIGAFILLSFSAIFIQQHLGRIELHFHVFVALAFLTVYKDFLPLIAGAGFTIVHHLLFNYLQSIDTAFFDVPLVIFNYGCGYDIVAIHSLFVLFETIMLLYINSMRQLSFSKILNTSRKLEYLNANLEKEVERKTTELRQTVEELEAANAELVKARNEALSSIEARANFISSVSHELRTPLNSIINFSDMILEDYDAMFTNEAIREENRDFLQRVYKNSKHLLSLINDILEFTKAEAGKMQYELAPVDVNPLLHNAFVNARGLINSSPIDARIELSDKPLIATIDKRRFFQVILNLVSNAVKFTDKGHITLRSYEENGKIHIDVEDSGRGIPEEKQESIFDPFTQVTHYDAGTGLGLVIVKKLCEDMQIELAMESHVGIGTRFTLSMEPAQV